MSAITSPIPLTIEKLPPIRERLLTAARTFWYSMRRWWWKSYWRMKTVGLENLPKTGPVILCANHTSHLDAPAILAALPKHIALRTSTAAAKDVFGDNAFYGLIGRLMTNCLPIERGADFAKGLRTLSRVLEEGRPLIIFPEGKRSDDGKLVEFQLGASMLALRNDVPIIPIHLDGLWASLAKNAHVPAPHDVTVRFGKPIRPSRYAGVPGRAQKREAYTAMTADLRKSIEELGARA